MSRHGWRKDHPLRERGLVLSTLREWRGAPDMARVAALPNDVCCMVARFCDERRWAMLFGVGDRESDWDRAAPYMELHTAPMDATDISDPRAECWPFWNVHLCPPNTCNGEMHSTLYQYSNGLRVERTHADTARGKTWLWTPEGGVASDVLEYSCREREICLLRGEAPIEVYLYMTSTLRLVRGIEIPVRFGVFDYHAEQFTTFVHSGPSGFIRVYDLDGTQRSSVDLHHRQEVKELCSTGSGEVLLQYDGGSIQSVNLQDGRAGEISAPNLALMTRCGEDIVCACYIYGESYEEWVYDPRAAAFVRRCRVTVPPSADVDWQVRTYWS